MKNSYKYISYISMIFLVSIVISMLILAYNDGVREVSDFNQIIVCDGGVYGLIITQGDTESLRVDTLYAKTGVSNNKLYLKCNRPAVYHVTVKDVNYIDLMSQGPGTVYIANLTLNNLSIKNNAAIILSNITAKNLIIDLCNGDLNEGTNLTINNLTIYKDGSLYKTYLNLVNSSVPCMQYTNIY